MNAILAPLYAAPLGKANLRFFKAPTAEPQIVWHVHDDLAACLGLPRDLRRQFRRQLANGPFKTDIKTIASPGGLVTVAPHYAAHGLIGAAIQIGIVGDEFETAYTLAAIEAFKTITAGWPEVEAFNYLLVAGRNTLRGEQ